MEYFVIVERFQLLTSLCIDTILMGMQPSVDIIKNQIIQVINKIIFSEKKRVVKFKGISLYPSEIHLLLLIENDMDSNATKIARQLGLTKGAISQTLARLEKKGIILKTKDPYHKNELNLSLTDFGKEAYALCQSTKVAFIEAHDEFLSKLNSKEKEVVRNFLLHVEKAIDKLERT